MGHDVFNHHPLLHHLNPNQHHYNFNNNFAVSYLINFFEFIFSTDFLLQHAIPIIVIIILFLNHNVIDTVLHLLLNSYYFMNPI